MRLVLDTNVVISGLLWNGPPSRLLWLGRKPGVRFCTSTPLLVELTETLSRPKFKKNLAISLLSVVELVDLYVGLAVLVHPVPVPRLAPDPDDDVVIGTGLAARAELIVTGDRTLLSMQKYEAVRIVSVADALDLLISL